MSSSPFIVVPPSEWVAENDLAFAIRDRYPVSPGHTLVIPKRVVPTWFDATPDEQSALLLLVNDVRSALDVEFQPHGYNIGFNSGEAAGQTVMHLHVHVIPRFTGDVPDPRGGIRGVIPENRLYPGAPGRPDDDPFAALPAFVHGEDAHFVRTLRDALLVAERVDIVAAFVQASGLDLLLGDLRDALHRGARVRFLTGDYLGITSADALRMLLRLADEHEALSALFFETDSSTPFHPKSYLFVRGPHGVAYVGSSNVSRSALRHAVEWNLRLVSSDDAATFRAISDRFEALAVSPRTQTLTRELIDDYEARAPIPQAPAPERRAPPPEPNELQVEALDALAKTRAAGHARGLVVLATGVGKTLLAAFDCKAIGAGRALFLAHREEILEQAKDSWQAVFPEKVVGTYRGGRHDRDADLLFGSVQTLSRAKHLGSFPADHFDYIVIDEFHHAAAATYRKVLDHFRPRFLLALTATPERMDGRSLLHLCGDNLVYRRDLLHGIARRLLVPFHYFGVKDTIDFEPIPWRSGKFDAAALTTAAATEERALHALAEYVRRAGDGAHRTLCFCCTVEHADYMAAFFNAQGRHAVAVHSGPTSAPRAKSLRDLTDGTLEIICAVDVFNEGLDVRQVDTVLMLRPTESPVIFLQQLGRGLRTAEGKRALTVIDFIGNHRSFLTKPQTLLFLLGQDLPPRAALDKIRDRALELPEGCTIDIELEAIDLLQKLAEGSAADIALYEYTSFRDRNGRRPGAAELLSAGVGFAPIRAGHDSWFHFVAAQGDASADEIRVLSRHAAWFSDLLATKMNKSYKMLALRALLDADALFAGMAVDENARRAFALAHEDALIRREMNEDEGRRSLDAAFVRQWRTLPLEAWAKGESTTRPWFRVEGDHFIPTFEVASEDRDHFEAMTDEMVEMRLAQHRDRLLRSTAVDATQAPAILSVSHAHRRPILRFDRARRPDIPEGVVPVMVDGQPYAFQFRKIAVNAATRAGGTENMLPDLLRRLFGPTTGQPGIRHVAQLVRDDDVWRLERAGEQKAANELAEILPFPTLPYFSDVKVACGGFDVVAQIDEVSEPIAIRASVEVDRTKHFVVTAEGDSMDGGATPIADGALVLCEWARGASAESVEGKPHLLVGHDSADASSAVIKVPRRTPTGWALESWNPDYPPQPVRADLKLEPVARVLGVVERAAGLVLWGEYDRDAIAAAFGSRNNPSWKVGHRDIDVGGRSHTILMVTLRKAGQAKLEHRYADRFLSRSEFQWESQASTAVNHLKGQRIVGHEAEGRAVHLFVEYDSQQNFTYLGTLRYVGHESEKPIRVRFELQARLPETLWNLWG